MSQFRAPVNRFRFRLNLPLLPVPIPVRAAFLGIQSSPAPVRLERESNIGHGCLDR
jgi:hypothetical protein